jgi:hypothetical protein
VDILKGCGNDLAELSLVVTPGKLQLTDDERLKRLHQVASSMRDRDVFSRDFCTRVRLLNAQRLQENLGIQTLNALYEAD